MREWPLELSGHSAVDSLGLVERLSPRWERAYRGIALSSESHPYAAATRSSTSGRMLGEAAFDYGGHLPRHVGRGRHQRRRLMRRMLHQHGRRLLRI